MGVCHAWFDRLTMDGARRLAQIPRISDTRPFRGCSSGRYAGRITVVLASESGRGESDRMRQLSETPGRRRSWRPPL